MPEIQTEMELMREELALSEDQLHSALTAFEELSSVRSKSSSVASDPGKNGDFASLLSPEQDIDARENFSGHNWYHSEHDGRWAGRSPISSIYLHKVEAGSYVLSLEFVRLIDVALARQVSVLWNGRTLPSTIRHHSGNSLMQRLLGRKESFSYPIVFDCDLAVEPSNGDGIDTLTMIFPACRIPSESDGRLLSARLRRVSLQAR